MARRQTHVTEVDRRSLQRSQATLANTSQGVGGSSFTERDIAHDKAFIALTVPKGGRAVRKMAVSARRYWPSANSQRAPSRPQGAKKSPR